MTLWCGINSGCCSESADSAGELFLQVQSAILRLEELAEERQQKLDGCLQLRQFEERASQASEVCRLSFLHSAPHWLFSVWF